MEEKDAQGRSLCLLTYRDWIVQKDPVKNRSLIWVQWGGDVETATLLKLKESREVSGWKETQGLKEMLRAWTSKWSSRGEIVTVQERGWRLPGQPWVGEKAQDPERMGERLTFERSKGSESTETRGKEEGSQPDAGRYVDLVVGRCSIFSEWLVKSLILLRCVTPVTASDNKVWC